MDQRMQELAEAIRQGKTSRARKILKDHPELISQRDEKKGDTPLHLAVTWDRVLLVEYLLNNGADVDAQNNDKKTPLFDAALFGLIKIAKMLIAAGADVNARAIHDTVPLNVANISLCHGSFHHNRAMFELLLSNGADINTKDKLNQSLLHGAVFSDRKKCIEYLISRGVDANSKDDIGTTPLHIASFLGKMNAVKALLAYGADINARDNSGKTPMDSAVDGYRIRTALYLYRRGGTMEIAPIFLAILIGNKTAIEKIIKSDPSAVTQTDEGEHTPLHWAAAGGKRSVVETILKHDVKINATDNRNITPLHTAAMNGNAEMVRILLEAGADPNTHERFNAETPLHRAVMHSHQAVIETLVAFGADVNALDRQGRSAVDWARQMEKQELLDILSG